MECISGGFNHHSFVYPSQLDNSSVSFAYLKFYDQTKKISYIPILFPHSHDASECAFYVSFFMSVFKLFCYGLLSVNLPRSLEISLSKG